jgi:hypothetical protein
MIGGEKYIVCGILFKFAIDKDNLFSSDFDSAKVAGHELKGLIACYNLTIPDIHVFHYIQYL